MIINERIKKVQQLMKEKGIDIYYIPTSDFHDSEYVDEFFACRKYMSGFSGSAGIMVITKDDAYLWSDGRYYLQAAKQIEGTCIKFMKWGSEGVLSPTEFIANEYKQGMVIGFDGRVVSAQLGKYFEQLTNGNVKVDVDLVGDIWEDRPALPASEVYVLEEKYAGKSLKDKLSDIRNVMNERNCEYHLINTLDDIAYILNLRANDIPCTPVFLSYLLIGKENATLFINDERVNDNVKAYLADAGVALKGYDEIYSVLENINDKKVMLDKNHINYRLISCLNGNVLLNAANPSSMMKACKNDVEVENIKKAHIKDGVAVTKFIHWIKKNVGKEKIDEYSAAEYLTSLRAQQDGFIEPSFETISAYKDNAAIVHYAPTKEDHAELKPNGMYLVDSGGQYYEGTTDITRTFALGEVTQEEKDSFTLVLKGMINLSRCKFLHGCSGINLDILARNSMWNREIDYKHGTGHGVGYLLGVHEGPQGIRWAQSAGRSENTTLEKGMVISNEPGMYIEGKYGIRIENLVVVKEESHNEYGQFLGFDTLTYVPIDLELINKDLLVEEEIEWLNNYHKDVYNKLSPFMDEEEKAWLLENTKAL